MNIKEELFLLGDKDYKEFHSKLIPNVSKNRIIGVRTPQLRQFAKKIAKTPEVKIFISTLPHRYYDEDKPIIFSEWSLVMGNSIKRRDFRLDVLLKEHEETSLQYSLFGDDATNPDYWETDPITKETIPAPTMEYPLTDYRRLRQDG